MSATLAFVWIACGKYRRGHSQSLSPFDTYMYLDIPWFTRVIKQGDAM